MDNQGASASQTGLSPTVEPASGLAGSAASIPSAGEWIVVCRRSYGQFRSHEYAQVDSVKTKVLHAKVGGGRRLCRVSLDEVIPARDKVHAQHIVERLDSARAEAHRRQQAASGWYLAQIGKAYAQAIEARRAETGTGSVHESAVAESDAPNSPSEDTPQ